MTQKPVLILKGMDHSSFCPGFQVPGDIFPADITDSSMANQIIGGVTANFLHLHTNQNDERKSEALEYLRE